MTADDTHVRTLRRAAELAGGEAALAEALQTTPEVLSKWLSGDLPPPRSIYFVALDIVTKRTLGRQRR